MKDTLGDAIAKAMQAAAPSGSCSTCGGIETAREAVVYHDIYTPDLRCPECDVLVTDEGKPVGSYTWDGQVSAMKIHEPGARCRSMGQLWEKPLGKWKGLRP